MSQQQLSIFDVLRGRREMPSGTDDAVTLRPYQTAAVDSVFDRWDSGDVSTLICLPTGTGKSVCFSEVMRRWIGEHS